MEQTPSTFELRLPASLLGICCDVLADQSGHTRRLSALTVTGEDVDIAVRREKREWIQLLFQGATGSIIDVLNDQWRCSIESINISPQPILSPHIAQNLSAAEYQPRISGHHPATRVGENGKNTSKKPAGSEAVVHQALVHHPAVVHEAPVGQQPEKRVTGVMSREIKTKMDLSRRKSLRVRERRQKLSTEPGNSAEIASGNACHKTEEDAEEDSKDAAVDKTGVRSASPESGKQARQSCKASEKKKKPHRLAERILLTCDVINESVMEEADLSCEGSDQSDTLSQDTSPLDDTGEHQLHMECVTDFDHADDDDQSEIAGSARKKRRTLTDPNVQPYLCPECHHPFIVAISLMRHISAAHRELPNYDAIVNSAEDLRSSRLKAASAICVSCPVCERNMRGTRVFTHMRKFHADDGDFDMLVALVKKQYYAERERVYQLNNWGKERVSCPHCGVVRARRRLSHHIRYQCKENADRCKFLRCRHCGYGTHRTDRLAQHMELHQDGTNFICDHCGKRYVSQAGLTVHLRQKHQESKRNPILSHPCPMCQKTFIHESRLKRHLTIHAAGDRRHVCDACGKTFKDRGTMNAHRRTQHLGQYRYRCDRCGHGVEKRSYLHTHRCNINTSNAAHEVPATDGRSVVVMAMHSEVGEIGRELTVNVDDVMFCTDKLAVNDHDTHS